MQILHHHPLKTIIVLKKNLQLQQFIQQTIVLAVTTGPSDNYTKMTMAGVHFNKTRRYYIGMKAVFYSPTR